MGLGGIGMDVSEKGKKGLKKEILRHPPGSPPP